MGNFYKNKIRKGLNALTAKNKKFFVNLKRLGIFATQHFSMFAANLFNGIKKTTVIIIVVLVIIIPVANGVGFNM